MVRIFYIHGVNARRELAHMFEGAPGSGTAEDRIKREFDRQQCAIVEKLEKAALPCFSHADVFPIYWGDLGSRIRYYRQKPKAERLSFEPLVQNGIVRNLAESKSSEHAQGGPGHRAAWRAPAPESDDVVIRLGSIAAHLELAEPTLKDVVLAEPRAALEVLFASEDDGTTDDALARLDARIDALSRRIREDANLRTELDALGLTVTDADRRLVERLARELDEVPGEHEQGKRRRWPWRPLVAAASAGIIPVLKSGATYAHGTRMMGDALIYFQRRGTREAPGAIVRRVLDGIHARSPRHPDGVPTVFVTHSLGCTILYDILTYFEPTLPIDLWVSIGSQLSLYEEVGILASSSHGASPPATAGARGRSPVNLPPHARWHNVVDPRDPVAYFAKLVFERVEDEILSCNNHQFDEIHNAYLEDRKLYARIREWLTELAVARRGATPEARSEAVVPGHARRSE
jgi:hypothetical protein